MYSSCAGKGIESSSKETGASDSQQDQNVVPEAMLQRMPLIIRQLHGAVRGCQVGGESIGRACLDAALLRGCAGEWELCLGYLMLEQIIGAGMRNRDEDCSLQLQQLQKCVKQHGKGVPPNLTKSLQALLVQASSAGCNELAG